MIYNEASHKKAFRAGVSSQLAHRVPGWRASLVRDSVIRGYLAVDPTNNELKARGVSGSVRYIMDLPRFRKEVGSIWIILLSAVIQALLKAIIEYWWQTKELEGEL